MLYLRIGILKFIWRNFLAFFKEDIFFLLDAKCIGIGFSFAAGFDGMFLPPKDFDYEIVSSWLVSSKQTL